LPNNPFRCVASVICGAIGAAVGAFAAFITRAGQIALAAGLGFLLGAVFGAVGADRFIGRQPNDAQVQINDGIEAQVIPSAAPETPTHHRIERNFIAANHNH